MASFEPSWSHWFRSPSCSYGLSTNRPNPSINAEHTCHGSEVANAKSGRSGLGGASQSQQSPLESALHPCPKSKPPAMGPQVVSVSFPHSILGGYRSPDSHKQNNCHNAQSAALLMRTSCEDTACLKPLQPSSAGAGAGSLACHIVRIPRWKGDNQCPQHVPPKLAVDY